jgi:hypothetical protein
LRKIFTILTLCAFLVLITGCGSLEQNSRDTIAAATGLIQSAQGQYQAECVAAPTSGTCVLINQGVHAQNALVTALEAYCGFQVGVTVPSATCTPIKGAAAALSAAIGNLNTIMGEITAIVQAGKKTAVLDQAGKIEAELLARSVKNPTLADLESVRIGGSL